MPEGIGSGADVVLVADGDELSRKFRNPPADESGIVSVDAAGEGVEG